MELIAMKNTNKAKWTKLPFGKYKGKTLPQIIMIDPDWFYWVAPKLYGRLEIEAENLAPKTTMIKIPKSYGKDVAIEYQYDHDGRFSGFAVVDANTPESRRAVRLPYLDLSAVHRAKKYNKSGCRRLIRDFRHYYFGGRKRVTRNRCERFFSKRRRFVMPF
jgi:hypothetical protein